MVFRKNRFQRLWIFIAYSLSLHLAVFLALVILVESHNQDSSSISPIIVRLINATPVTLETRPMPRTPQATEQEMPASSPEQHPAVPSLLTPFFQMVPQPKSSVPAKNSSVGPEQHTHSLIRIATTALVPQTVAGAASGGIQRANRMDNAPHRVLVDHKAGRVLAATTPPKILYNPVPPYPRVARELGLEGKTLLRVEILRDGRPGMIQVRKSCGHTVLDEAAATAIKQWKFAPAHDGLFAIRSVVDLPIRFSLKSLG